MSSSDSKLAPEDEEVEEPDVMISADPRAKAILSGFRM